MAWHPVLLAALLTLAGAAQAQNTGNRAHVTQTGEANLLEMLRRGSAGQDAIVRQDGMDNTMLLDQASAGPGNEVLAAQSGTGNALRLEQSGSGNQAILAQHGSGNSMSAVQMGDNNRLGWTQIGDNLADLAITQTGNQAVQITQGR
jgi:hypothetical protein